MTLTGIDGQICITRVFDAPRELVFRAWTDPEILARWYAPNGCTLTIREIEVRPGGVVFYGIKNPSHPDCWCRGVFEEVVPPERIAFTLGLVDEEGRPLPEGGSAKDPEWPDETTITVIFEEEGGRTRITLHQNALESVARRTGAYPSWLQMLDRLEQELKEAR